MLDSSDDDIQMLSDEFIGRFRENIWEFLELLGHGYLSEEDLTDEQLEAVIHFIAEAVAHYNLTGELDMRDLHEGVKWVIDRHGGPDTDLRSYRHN